MDVGTCTTKAGYAGEDAPRCVVPSVRTITSVLIAMSCGILGVVVVRKVNAGISDQTPPTTLFYIIHAPTITIANHFCTVIGFGVRS